jgi:glucosylceramidase
MKKIYLSLLLFSVSLIVFGQKSVEWVSTTETHPWMLQKQLKTAKTDAKPDVTISSKAQLQSIEGFGGCFNELGWTSLNSLAFEDKEVIFKELFSPNGGANFTVCRMPVGANDFSLDWYSYDDTEGDFELKNFSIDHDSQTLVPFIKEAQRFNPNLKIWASPWSPPSWMKWNNHYACASTGTGMAEKFRNQLPQERQGKEGTNMFIQEAPYFKTYAQYFGKFIQAYREEGIKISTVMPQNEFNSCQIFPSCTWTAKGLATFIGKYLGPEMTKQHVELMFGTMERPDEALVDTILNDPDAGKYIKGVGFQWAGKGAIAGIHKRYPDLKLYQSEQECGNGKNDWKYCCYTWDLMKHYLNSGANSYLYWNISLPEGGFSRWGWQQNSLVTVNSEAKTYKFNHEYYLLKHLSHYVMPGARLLKTEGDFTNLLAFRNLDNSVVLVVQNETSSTRTLKLKIDLETIEILFDRDSFNTLIFR